MSVEVLGYLRVPTLDTPVIDVEVRLSRAPSARYRRSLP